MSHYRVVVTLPANVAHDDVADSLTSALAPFDESMEVEPYREYETGEPNQFWWVRSVRQGAQHHLNGTGITRPDNSSEAPFPFTREPQRSVAEQRAAFAADAAFAAQLGNNPGWDLVVALYTEAYPDSSDDGGLHYEPATGRAYSMSTYNPKSRWDWWVIGGRWQRRLIARQGVDSSALLIGEPGSFGDNGSPHTVGTGVACDGGRVRYLDFEAVRAQAAAGAALTYDAWEKICASTPEAESWPSLLSRAKSGEFDIEKARALYNDQPRIQAAREADLSWDCPVEQFAGGREAYLAEARNGAMGGLALLTTDGDWWEPGRMGWFGISSDTPESRAEYRTKANAYLDGLDPEVWVISVDCHI